MSQKLKEIIIPYELQTFLQDITESKHGYKLGNPWKYSEESLGVVVPIMRENSPDREYVTMYEVLDQLNMKDTGHINQVQLQNDCGMAIFIRAGTIFTGKTQNRAVQHSGIYQEKNANINVNCVYQTHGIRQGTEMKFGDISPPSVTVNLMTGNQSKVWESVHRFTSGTCTIPTHSTISINVPTSCSSNVKNAFECIQRFNNWSGVNCEIRSSNDGTVRVLRVKPSEDVTQIWRGSLSEKEVEELSGLANNFTSNSVRSRSYGFSNSTASSGNIFENILSDLGNTTSDNLYGHLQKIKNQSILDDMMQRVPLFNNQVGAIIFNPVGVIALETFDHPKSWESIKKEIIEKFGDKIKEEQAEHLFELKPEMILPAIKKFIKGLEKFTEKIIRKDNFSETREVIGDKIIGEYTLVKGQTIHALLLRDIKN